MDDQDLPLLTPVTFVKGEGKQRKQVHLTRFEDNGAYIEGDEEIIFEGEGVGLKAPWRSALKYLQSHGYRKAI